MKHIALLLLIMSHCFIQPSFADQRFQGYNIVHGTVVRIDKSSTPWSAWISISKIYGKVKADVKPGDEFRMRTGNFSGPNGDGPHPRGNDFSFVTPELTVGETGIWAMAVDNYGNKQGDSFGMYGRAWPSIKGRDQSFADVELWAKELDGDTARQEDYDGEKWPAPKYGYKSYEASPTPAPNTQSTLTPNPPPTMQPAAPKKAPEAKPTLAPSEEPASSTPWSMIVVLIGVAGGLLWLLLKRRS